MAEKPDNEPKADQTAEDVADGSGSRKKAVMVTALGSVLSALLAFVFAGVLYPYQPEPGGGQQEDQKEDALDPELEELGRSFFLELPDIQTTLADPNRDGFVRIVVSLEMRAQEPAAIQSAIEGELGVRLRDALITHVSGLTAAELKTTEGKELLKLELIELLDGVIFPDSRTGKVTGLYFSQFLVQ